MELAEYLDRGVSPFHVVKNVIERLENEGFVGIKPGDSKELIDGKGYYISPYPSVVFAFRVNSKKSGMHIGLAHTDSPSFMIKPNPEMPEKPYLRVNVEPYGGMLKRTWFDRPLGLAGRVMLKNEENVYDPKQVLFDSEEPWFVIPSLAPHLDHEIETTKINPQNVMLPIYGLYEGMDSAAGEKVNEDESRNMDSKDLSAGEVVNEDVSKDSAPGEEVNEDASNDSAAGEEASKEKSLLERVAAKLSVSSDDILSYDLYLYNADKSQYIGSKKEMLLAP
ncbi:MAG: hypothetical protein K6G11_04640, partial [Lachnospiraceae bacterium]|nr:hypothetical protein [Lachnospiraceae bacterium]